MFKTCFLAQDGRRENSKKVLESPGNNESNYVFKTFYDACEENDDLKRPRTPMCGARRGEWACVIDVAHRGQGYINSL